LELGAHNVVTTQVEVVAVEIEEIAAAAKRDAGGGRVHVVRVPHRPGWSRLDVAVTDSALP
jgi:hypothetical protein